MVLTFDTSGSVQLASSLPQLATRTGGWILDRMYLATKCGADSHLWLC
jgi:hypothetical protein